MPALSVVTGDEPLLVDRAVGRRVQAVVARADNDAASVPVVSEHPAADLAPGELATLTSPSLFAEERVLVVRGLGDASKDLVAALVALGEQQPEGITVVVIHQGGRAKSALDALRGAGAEVETVTAVKTVRDREQFVVDEVRRAGGDITRDAAADLVAALGSDLREIAIACEQLVADVGGRLDARDIAAHHRGRAESTGFAVADRAVEGNTAQALETLRWALSTGVDPVLVTAALANNLRTIGIVGAAGRHSPDSLAGPLGMPAWRIRRAQGWLRSWRPEALAVAVQAVHDADLGVKGAADDAAYAVERAVIAVANAATGVRPAA